MKLLEMDPSKVNVNGGAVALGHPLGCTGAKLTATILQEMHRRNARYGMVTMCVGGGMGAAAGIFERFEFIDSLQPKDGAIRIHKRYGNSFNKTELDSILKGHGVDTIVMTGFCAEYCVLSTYRGAKDLDYFPVLLKNGIASTQEANKEFVEKISETITAGVLVKLLAEE
jgi:nicotinamidase-related amidase